MLTNRLRNRLLATGAATVVAAVCLVTVGSGAAATQPPADLDRALLAHLHHGGTIDFLVHLHASADLSTAPGDRDRDRDRAAEHVYRTLTYTAENSQADLIRTLTTRGIDHTPYWIANVVRVRGDRALVDELAARADVAAVTTDPTWRVPQPDPGPGAAADAAPAALEWGLIDIGAHRVWEEFGITGEGVVVATIDTGVQFDHPALVGQYRGNLGGGQFDHNYHWFDPTGVCAPTGVPCDNVGMGSYVTGIMVGDDGGSNQIGVAPGAKWIAAKGCGSFSCSLSNLLAAAQWVLAPTDLTGQNPDPSKAPQVVAASWGSGIPHSSVHQAIQAWAAAGILPVFPAGGGGPACGTVGYPAAHAEAYAVSGYTMAHQILPNASRGSPFVNVIKPDITAPGQQVRSAWRGGGYQILNGGTPAVGHVAGAAALVLAAGGPVPALLDQAAIDVVDLSCGGQPGNNNVWGEGRLDVYTAVKLAL